MSAESGTEYRFRINEKNEIVEFDDEWRRFAVDNEAEGLPDSAVGSALRSHVTGKEVWEIYENLIERARSSGREISFPYRCDSPTLRRYMRMTIAPLPDRSVEFRSVLEKVEERPAAPMLNPTAEEGEGKVRVCAWCKRVWASAWLEVEEAVPRLGLFDEPLLPPITHGICEDCAKRIFA